VTDVNGAYSFTNLQAGTYSLTDTPPANYHDQATTAGTVAGITDGNVPTLGTISNVALNGGDFGINYDFLLLTYGSQGS
jgi:hypothetical protein